MAALNVPATSIGLTAQRGPHRRSAGSVRRVLRSCTADAPARCPGRAGPGRAHPLPHDRPNREKPYHNKRSPRPARPVKQNARPAARGPNLHNADR